LISSRLYAALAFSAVLAVLAVGATACGSSKSSSSAGTINGAGSTFAKPLISQWGSDLKGKGLTVNYNGIGSGGGISQFEANTVDFGDTDAAMKDSDIKVAQKHGTPVHIPIIFGAVTVDYNLTGVKTGLKLDGPTLANIFLGKIKSWNDPAIAKLNPGVKLPGSAITVVHRSDSSGTTALFTQFLSDTSPQWKSQIGSDTTVKWPVGTGANGSDGVASAVQATQGAIGYDELAYAIKSHFTTADVKNSSGVFEAPTLAATEAAGTSLKLPPDLRFSTVNAPGPTAYPIASATFVIVYQDLCKAGKSQSTAKNLVKFLNYGLSAPAQAESKKLGYAPLATNVHGAAQSKVKSLTCNGKPIKA
jgi:phosphate transport system substrate-binding protein